MSDNEAKETTKATDLAGRVESLVGQWTRQRPMKAGHYWFHKNSSTRVVSIWERVSDGALFTNEDGGAPVADEIYDGGLWWSASIATVPTPND